MPQTVPVEKPEPPPFVKSVINALTAEVATRGKIADEMDYPLLECQPFRFARYGDIVRRWVSIEETEFELAPLSDATVGLLNDPDVATVSLQAARVWTIKQIDNVMRAGHSLAALVDKSIPVSIEGRDKLLRFEAERAIKVVSAHAQPAPAQAAAATPVPTATAVAPAAAPQPAPAKPAVEKKARDLQRVATVEGKLAYAGERQYGEGSSSFNCYTVDVEKDNGETVELRGKMLEKCITDGRFTTGQRVRVTNLGKQWVNVLDESTRTYARRQMGTFTVEAL
jgi:hypothetical protein